MQSSQTSLHLSKVHLFFLRVHIHKINTTCTFSSCFFHRVQQLPPLTTDSPIPQPPQAAELTEHMIDHSTAAFGEEVFIQRY